MGEHSFSVSSVGMIDNTICHSGKSNYTLCSVKNCFVKDKPAIPVGYLYHASDMENTKLYYSANQLDRPEEFAKLSFSLNDYVVAVSPTYGDIICVKNVHRHQPVVFSPKTSQETLITGLKENPIGWLQNCGCDFGIDEDGNEFFVFGEYTGADSKTVTHINIWKVTYPYSEAGNWEIVHQIERTSVYRASEEGRIWHVHTCQRDPYHNIWYATTGDEDLSCIWWYSTDNGMSWTKFHDGTLWDSQVARVLNFVFTEEYIYWANDYGTNHCLSKLSRDENHIIDISTYEKLAELNKLQSTYATCYMEYPKGLLMCDRVDLAFSDKTDTLSIQFYDFETKKVYGLKRFKRQPWHDKFFGLRCKCYTLRQSPYEKRMAMGFDSSAPNWLDIAGNEDEDLSTLVFEIV